MITRIEVTNYRCFSQLDIDLGSLGVLIGPNGAGKSTLLDVPVLLGDLLATDNISTAFLKATQPRGPRAGSLTELIHKGRGDWFILSLEAELPNRVVRDLLEAATNAVKQDEARWPKFLRYELRLQVFGGRALQVQNEYLFTFSESQPPPRNQARLHGEINPRRDWDFSIRREYGGEAELRVETKLRSSLRKSTLDASLLALPKVRFEGREAFPAAHWLLDQLTEATVLFNPDWSDLRVASPPGLSDRLAPDGRNMPWLALALRQQAPANFEAWKEHVSIALPQIAEIDVVEREEDHHAYFRVRYRGGHEVTSSGLSDGTLRVMALTLLSYVQPQPGLLMVEEPENGIHPQAIEAVLDSFTGQLDSQVLLASHSPVVVANVALENLLVARIEADGSASIVPGSKHPRLAEWKGNLDLGSLFAAGVLG
ncbi:MAG: hypothetical protein AMXMBFR36_08960 [Acidobacteriota bacterium]